MSAATAGDTMCESIGRFGGVSGVCKLECYNCREGSPRQREKLLFYSKHRCLVALAISWQSNAEFRHAWLLGCGVFGDCGEYIDDLLAGFSTSRFEVADYVEGRHLEVGNLREKWNKKENSDLE